LKVHHIINSYSLAAGGAERVVRALHAGLPEVGVESALLGIERHKDDDVANASSLGLDSPYSLGAFLGIRAYIRNSVGREDIVHAHLFPSSFYVALLKQFGCIQGPTVLTEHSTHNGRRGTVFGSLIDSVLYSGFDRIVAISEGVRAALGSWKPKIEPRVSVVTNGVTPIFDAVLTRPQRKTLRILSMGSLRVAKNYRKMIEAVSLLSDFDFEYWIAGEGSEKAELVQLADQLGVGEKVQFLGFVKDTGALMEQSDIFLMASTWEGFGLAALEAMNSSLPLVLSDIPGLNELAAGEEKNALLVSPSDEDEIASALGELLKSHALREQLGAAGFKKSQMHSESAMCLGYATLYGGSER
jgi:glycosyltransferase involved in cell wall biosynthesis